MTIIPRLPTDNLYKFCAITGVVTMLAAISGCGFVTYQFLGLKRALSWEIAELRIDQEALGEPPYVESSNIPTRHTDFFGSGYAQTGPAKATGPVLKPERTSLQIQKTKALIELREGELQFYHANFAVVWKVAGVICFVGLVIAQYGFLNWRKNQLLQDSLLEARADGKPQETRGGKGDPDGENEQ